MPRTAPFERARLVLVAMVLATLSGFLSATTLDPVSELADIVFRNDMLAVLSGYALSAGLAFGAVGCGFIVWALRMRFAIGATFMALCVTVMAAAALTAISGHIASYDSHVTAYLLASGVGAVILAAPSALLLQVAAPLRVIALAVALPTIWAVGVAFVFGNPHDTSEISSFSVFYIGWQALFLGVFAAARREGA